MRNVFLDFGAIKEVKVMRDQCYAFVTFERKEVVQDLIMRYAHQPLLASGHELRINEAYGQMPSWKVIPSLELLSSSTFLMLILQEEEFCKRRLFICLSCSVRNYGNSYC